MRLTAAIIAVLLVISYVIVAITCSPTFKC